MASPHGLTFTANGFSPSNWETWEEVPCDAKDTVQDAVQADSWSWTEPLIQALQRVQKLQGTGRTELSFEALKLQSLEPFLEVQALPRQLTKLSLRDNPWQDPALLLSQLQPLHQLISLDLSKCRLDSLTNLPRLQLRHLRLEENQLRSTLGIAGCPRLLEVSLARNRLNSTEQLETLLELRVLDLAENCLTSSQRCLRPLAACTQLSELHLQGNPLAKDGNPLRSLFPSLETLDSRPLRRSRWGVATPVVPTAVPAPRGPWRDDGAVATEYLGKMKSYARPTRSSAIKACRAAAPDAEPPPPPLCPRARAPPRPRSFAPPPRALEPVETGPRTSPKKEPFVASLVPQRGTTRIGHDQGTVDQLMRCRDLIEEKRRLLQKITSKLGEGVAKTSFSAP